MCSIKVKVNYLYDPHPLSRKTHISSAIDKDGKSNRQSLTNSILYSKMYAPKIEVKDFAYKISK